MSDQKVKILFLGGFSMMCEAVEWAKSQGYYTIVTDYYPNSPAKLIADEALDISTAEIDDLAAYCERNNVTGCFAAFDDFNVEMAARLSEAAGLNYYASSEQTMQTMDKGLFKKNLCKYGVPFTPEFSQEECGDERVFPVIVKPVDRSGSRGITVCRDCGELNRALAAARESSRSGGVLIEKYFDGDEVGVNYLLQDGEMTVSAMHDRYLQASSAVGPVKLPLAYVYPSKYLDRYLGIEDNQVKSMFKKLGLRNGSLFLQGCVEDGVVYYYEMGYRLNGAKQYQIIEQECSVNPMHALIDYAITGAMSDRSLLQNIDPHFKKKYATLSLLANPGQISEIRGVSDISEKFEAAKVTQWCRPGDVIPRDAEGTQKQIVTRITLAADNLQELAAQIEYVNSVYDVLGEDGHSMIVERFNVAKLFE